MESLFLTSTSVFYQSGEVGIPTTTSPFVPSQESFILPLTSEETLSSFEQEIDDRPENVFLPESKKSESPFSSFNFISDDYHYDDDEFEYDDFDDEFDEDFEQLPDDDLEDFPDPYSDDEGDDEDAVEEVEIDPFDDFDEMEADENTFANDDEDESDDV